MNFLEFKEAFLGRKDFTKAQELSPEAAQFQLEQEVSKFQKLPGKNPTIPDAHIRTGSFEQYLAAKGILEGNGLFKTIMPANQLQPTQNLNYNKILRGETVAKPIIVIYDPNKNTYDIIDGHTKWGKARLMDFQYPDRFEDIGSHKVDCWILKGNFYKLYEILRDFNDYSKQNIVAKPDYNIDPETAKKKSEELQKTAEEFWNSLDTTAPTPPRTVRRSLDSPRTIRRTL